MEVILSYLENMFLHMPKRAEVLRAKEELASMMEDKYNELLAEGKKENEAVGIVISEFGDLSELAESLGLGDAYNNSGADNDTQTSEQPAKNVSLSEAEEYMHASVKSSKWIALGVALCIYCPIPLVFMGGIDSYVKGLTDLSVVLMGIFPLFIMIGIAVGIFIANGIKMGKYEYLKKERIQIDYAVEKYLNAVEEESSSPYTRNLVIGVLLCIFSVIPVLITGSITDDSIINVISVILLLVMIGIAVAIFIISGSRMECIKVLKQEGDFTVRSKEDNKAIEVIAGIYWPIATVIYLAWSFVTMNWGITWIVWPIAGIMFGAIVVIYKVVSKAVKQSA